MYEALFEPEFANILLEHMADIGNDTHSYQIRRVTKWDEVRINMHLRHILDNYPGIIRESQDELKGRPNPSILIRTEDIRNMRAFLKNGGFMEIAKKKAKEERNAKQENWPKRNWKTAMVISAFIGAVAKTGFDLVKDAWVSKHEEIHGSQISIADSIANRKTIQR